MDKGSVTLFREEEDRVKSRGKGHLRSDWKVNRKQGGGKLISQRSRKMDRKLSQVRNGFFMMVIRESSGGHQIAYDHWWPMRSKRLATAGICCSRRQG